jgi:hypothetical protein
MRIKYYTKNIHVRISIDWGIMRWYILGLGDGRWDIQVG